MSASESMNLLSEKTQATAMVSRRSLTNWQNAKFGLFLHWGVYSLGAGQWKGSWVATEGPWAGKEFSEFLQLQARVPVAEYEAFARGFRPAGFDADAWVRAAKAAGMRYVVFTTKHHEGFAMYHSAASPFNIVDHAGFPRDPLGELAEACERHGLMVGVYYSLGRDWHDPDTPTNWPSKGGRSNTWDFPDEDGKDFARYFRRKALPQVRELLSHYGRIAVLWFDTPEQITAEQSAELMALARELQPECLVNDRVGRHGGGMGDYQTFEQEVPESGHVRPWEACATLGRNWGYHPHDADWKTPEQIVRLLTDVVAKGGNLLFNIGPKGDGSWPAGTEAHLKAVGDWLAVNGAAIYGCTRWKVVSENGPGGGAGEPEGAVSHETETADTVRDAISRENRPDLRFTLGPDGAIHVIARSWISHTVEVRALGAAREGGREIKSASLIGHGGAISWRQDAERLTLSFPPERPGKIAVWVFRLEVAS